LGFAFSSVIAILSGGDPKTRGEAMNLAAPPEIVQFWRDAGPDKWFAANEAFDREIRTRFLTTYEAAARGDLAVWEGRPEEGLALLILLDQFPRNMFRGAARAFASDPLARQVAEMALARGFDQSVDKAMRLFCYLPFMHSEALADQDRSLQLFEALGDAEQLNYAIIHRDIIARFGRFPHRNGVLGRVTTPAERRFLDEGSLPEFVQL
jgi:uncharacterized protein (DUF924 family)